MDQPAEGFLVLLDFLKHGLVGDEYSVPEFGRLHRLPAGNELKEMLVARQA